MTQITFDSPLGPMTVIARDGAITALDWGAAPDDVEDCAVKSNLLLAARDQLAGYFDGELRVFDLPLAPAGTAFQQSVWREMLAIPYGDLRRYGDLAAALESAPRAVGGACGRNPIPIIIPCHRVVAAHGLGGFSGSGQLETKRFLIALEGAAAWHLTAPEAQSARP